MKAPETTAFPEMSIPKSVCVRKLGELHCLFSMAVARSSVQAMKVTKAKAVRAMPKSGIAAQVAESTGLKKKDVTQVLASLADVGAKEAAQMRRKWLTLGGGC